MSAVVGMHHDDQAGAAVLGIDPGRHLGLAVLGSCETGSPHLVGTTTAYVPHDLTDGERCDVVSDAIHHARHVARQAHQDIVAIAAERQFIGPVKKSVVRQLIYNEGFARGVAQMSGLRGILAHDLSTSQIAQFLETPNNKAARNRAVLEQFPALEGRTDHELDAVAVAWAVANRIEW